MAEAEGFRHFATAADEPFDLKMQGGSSALAPGFKAFGKVDHTPAQQLKCSLGTAVSTQRFSIPRDDRSYAFRAD